MLEKELDQKKFQNDQLKKKYDNLVKEQAELSDKQEKENERNVDLNRILDFQIKNFEALEAEIVEREQITRKNQQKLEKIHSDNETLKRQTYLLKEKQDTLMSKLQYEMEKGTEMQK